MQVVLGALIIAGGLGAVWAPKRFMAVLMVSLCGWGSLASLRSKAHQTWH